MEEKRHLQAAAALVGVVLQIVDAIKEALPQMKKCAFLCYFYHGSYIVLICLSSYFKHAVNSP